MYTVYNTPLSFQPFVVFRAPQVRQGEGASAEPPGGSRKEEGSK